MVFIHFHYEVYIIDDWKKEQMKKNEICKNYLKVIEYGRKIIN